MKRITKLCFGLSLRSYFESTSFLEKHQQSLMFFLGIILLHQGLEHSVYAGTGSFGQACNGLLSLVEGTFGALVTAAAGIGAIVASAMGGFKMAWTLIVVSVGSFVLRSYITLFNGDCGIAAVGATLTYVNGVAVGVGL